MFVKLKHKSFSKDNGLQDLCSFLAGASFTKNKRENIELTKPLFFVDVIKKRIIFLLLSLAFLPSLLSAAGISLSLNDSLIQNPDELSVFVTFESFGTVPTDVNLTFIILDEFENEYAVDKDFFVVTTEEVLRKKFKALFLPEGKYTLVLQTLYNVDVFDEFKVEFEIGKEKRVITGRVVNLIGGEGNLWIVAGVIGLFAIGGLVWWLNGKVKKNPKKKNEI